MLIHISKFPSGKRLFSLQKSKIKTCSLFGSQPNVITQNTKGCLCQLAAITKIPWTGLLVNNNNLFIIVLEARSLKSRCWCGQILISGKGLLPGS